MMRKMTLLALLCMALLLLAGCAGGELPQAAPASEDVPLGLSSGAEIGAAAEAEDLASAPPEETVDYCLECHTDKERLIDTARPEEEVSSESKGEGWGGEVAPLEPWEKVLVDGKNFTTTVHGIFSCTSCHGGVQSSDKDSAHSGLIENPSEGPEVVCAQCHPDVAHVFENSLHATLGGYWTALEARSVPENHAALEEMFGNHCSSCHTTCGDCHVSQPSSVGGGLFSGHIFEKTPPMTRSCTACHGSRVGNEYLGKHEGIPGDVHFREGRMNCIDCHSGFELHGQPSDCAACHSGSESAQIPPPDHRYSGVQTPRCESCHFTVTTAQDDIDMHLVHGADLSCQVCHSITYTSCDGCHVAVSENTGKPYFETEASYLTFLIGKNIRRSYDRPYDFVPVRHVPISPASYSYYGENLLSNFDSLSTWTYATPHNVQLNTPQNASCNACHANASIFLTADKVAPEELNANRGVIVDVVPAALPELLQAPAMPADHNGRSVCLVCHEKGAMGPSNPPDHSRYQDSICRNCHILP